MLANLIIGLTILFSLSSVAAKVLLAADEPEGLLQRIRSRMATHLSQLPNYTCHQVTDRLTRRASAGSLERVDRVELEVAFVGSRELFSKPGETRFEEQEIHNLVPVGTIGNGAFGAHVATIFSGDAATFTFIGPSKKDGHKTLRYDFTVPQDKSHFLVRHAAAQGIVGYKGSFWVDFETLDLVRVELKVDHIPSYIGISSIEESMRYTAMRIRDSEFLLPQHSQLVVFDQSSNYSLNMIRLERCREFTGESVVTYGGPVDGTSADRQAAPR
jgi:hypothetical protein